jgi:PHP family Zn ribbon phosphoesterase
MRYTADLHLHSKYSRAVSKNMILSVMAEFAESKGIDLLSASDWTHTLWFKEIQGQLLEAGEGVYRLRSEISNFKSQISNDQKEVYFLLSTEISSIYKHGEKLRRIHNLVFVPNFAVAEKVNKELLKRGCNLSADGRPIIGLSSRNLLEMLLSIDERCLLIPCHVWTPHFGVYGSKSGFDSLDEAFGDLAPYVYGIETGISSDPEMNWRIPELANRSILSFSDAHSPANMGREATVFELEKLTYENVRQAIMRSKGTTGKKARDTRSAFVATSAKEAGTLDTRDTLNKIAYTIEFYPEEGKYHFSGHRNCKVSLSPEEVAGKGIVCPVCRREFTEGVAIRIEQLAGSDFAKSYKEKLSESGIMWHTDQAKNHPPYVKLVRLEQIIAAGLGVGVASQRVTEAYKKLVPVIGSEINVLLRTPLAEVERIAGSRAAQALKRVREGDLEITPGYDGEYGKVRIWKEGEDTGKVPNAPQLSLDF